MTTSPPVARDAGVASGMAKVAVSADVREVVVEALRGHLPPGVEPQGEDVLDDLVPDGNDLEQTVLYLEDAFDTSLSPDETFRLFSGGTVNELVAMLSSKVVKTAAADVASHQRYMANRERHKARARAYRLAHLTQVRRKAKIYRRQVARKIRRPRRRIGSAAAGYMFVPR